MSARHLGTHSTITLYQHNASINHLVLLRDGPAYILSEDSQVVKVLPEVDTQEVMAAA